MENREIKLEEIEKAVKEAFYSNPQDRIIKVITWQGGYDLFCEAMKERGFEIKNLPEEK